MIRMRLLVGFVLVALLPVIGIGTGTLLVSYHNGRQQSIDRLESVAARKELAIQGWEQTVEQELLFVSQMDCSPKFVSTALRLANEGKRYTWYNDLARKRLQGFVDRSTEVEEIFLVDLQGRVVVSTDLEREATVYQDHELFQRAQQGPYTQLPFYSVPPAGTDGSAAGDPPFAFVGIPVLAENGELMGVMGGRAGIEAVHAILQEGTGLGQTGRAYLVDAHRGALVGTGLSAGGPAAPGQEIQVVRTSGVEAAIEGTGTGSGVYTGSLGTAVIGVHRWIPGMQAVLLVEQDLSEAFRAVATTTGIDLAIALAAVSIAVVASLFMTRSIADPIVKLSGTAAQIAQGDLQRVATVERDDEVGALARAFNSMTAQLRDLINSLEHRVQERTHALQKANEVLEQRALQLQTSARVGREITSILDIDSLLSRVVEMIQEAFGYYHTQVFLLDRDANQLVLRASSGNKSLQHRRLDLDQPGINTRAVQTGQTQLVDDALQDPGYQFDSQLPETRSELVVPLRLGEQVIGTLDVHNTRAHAFSGEDRLVVQSLGDQIAVAIENAHLYDQSRELAVVAERNRLARELHDSVTQSLYSLVLLTEGWRRLQSSGNGAQTEDYLGRVGEIAQQALKEMRLLIHELRPPMLEQEGLVGALRRRLDAVEKRVGIEARVVMDDFFDLPTPVEAGLYRIAQEALNNALKHAEATSETVHICVDGDTVVLTVDDDGQGFDPEAAENRGGMGLGSMRERAALMGGTLAIHSRRGDGTTVQVIVPLSGQGPAD